MTFNFEAQQLDLLVSYSNLRSYFYDQAILLKDWMEKGKDREDKTESMKDIDKAISIVLESVETLGNMIDEYINDEFSKCYVKEEPNLKIKRKNEKLEE